MDEIRTDVLCMLIGSHLHNKEEDMTTRTHHISPTTAHASPVSDAMVAALRDFFASENDQELRESVETMVRCRHNGILPFPGSLPKQTDTDWRQVEFAFNRLFIGPAAVPAPLYASAYADGQERQLMGEATLQARRLYAEMGFSIPDAGVIPDDHLAFELDAVLALRAAAANHAETPAEHQNAGEKNDTGSPFGRFNWFVTHHMAAWLPQFITAARASLPEDTAPDSAEALISWVLAELECWFTHECQWLADQQRTLLAPHNERGEAQWHNTNNA